jgi:hypothetical protein
VWRGPGGPGDAEELRAIRAGAWTYDAVVEWAEQKEAELDAIWRAGTFVVPRAPDRDAIDALCVELARTALRP